MADSGVPRRASNGFVSPRVNAPNPSANTGGRKPRHGVDSAVGKASELFQALRAENPDLDDEELLNGPDYHVLQRKYMQEKQQQKVIERLERRVDTGAPSVGNAGRRRSSIDGGYVAEHLPGADATRNRRSSECVRSSLEVLLGVHRRSSLECGIPHEHTTQRATAPNLVVSAAADTAPRASPLSPPIAASSSAGLRSVYRPISAIARKQLPNSERADSAVAAVVAAAAAPSSGTPAEPLPPTGSLPYSTPVLVTPGPDTTAARHPKPRPRFSHRQLQAVYDGAATAPHLLSSLTEDDLFAATSALAAVEAAYDPSGPRGLDRGLELDHEILHESGDPEAGAGAVAGWSQAPLELAGDPDTGAGRGDRDVGMGMGMDTNYQGRGPEPDMEVEGWTDGGPMALWSEAANAADATSSRAAADTISGSGCSITKVMSDVAGVAYRHRAVITASSPLPYCHDHEYDADTGLPRRVASVATPAALSQYAVPLPPTQQQQQQQDGQHMASLALVEVKPLADHIPRDGNVLIRQHGDRPSSAGLAPWASAADDAVRTSGAGGGTTITPAAADALCAAGGGGGCGGGGGGGEPRGAAGGDVSNNKERPATASSVGTYEEFGDLAQFSRCRQLAIRLCSNPDFEMVVTAIIFANTATLCLYNPRQPADEGLNAKMFWAELSFNICFSVEMLLRILSMGSLWAYIRRPWNLFDSMMVVAGYTVFVPGQSSAVNAIRALRALRPLRTITRFDSLRGVIVCFLEAIPLLASVGGLLIFFIFIYAVAAVQLFPKTYHWTCVDAAGLPLTSGEDPDMQGCGGSGHCPDGYTCTFLDQQFTLDVAGFDNTGRAMLSVWQALTLTGWVFMMYRTVDAYSLGVVVYYVTLVFLGAYFVLNLFLAVLKIKFAKAQTLFHNQLALQRGRARNNTIMTFMGKVTSRWTEYSSKRSQASLLNSKLSSAINSRMSSVGSQLAPTAASVRMSGPGGFPAAVSAAPGGGGVEVQGAGGKKSGGGAAGKGGRESDASGSGGKGDDAACGAGVGSRTGTGSSSASTGSHHSPGRRGAGPGQELSGGWGTPERKRSPSPDRKQDGADGAGSSSKECSSGGGGGVGGKGSSSSGGGHQAGRDAGSDGSNKQGVASLQGATNSTNSEPASAASTSPAKTAAAASPTLPTPAATTVPAASSSTPSSSAPLPAAPNSGRAPSASASQIPLLKEPSRGPVRSALSTNSKLKPQSSVPARGARSLRAVSFLHRQQHSHHHRGPQQHPSSNDLTRLLPRSADGGGDGGDLVSSGAGSIGPLDHLQQEQQQQQHPYKSRSGSGSGARAPSRLGRSAADDNGGPVAEATELRQQRVLRRLYELTPTALASPLAAMVPAAAAAAEAWSPRLALPPPSPPLAVAVGPVAEAVRFAGKIPRDSDSELGGLGGVDSSHATSPRPSGLVAAQPSASTAATAAVDTSVPAAACVARNWSSGSGVGPATLGQPAAGVPTAAGAAVAAAVAMTDAEVGKDGYMQRGGGLTGDGSIQAQGSFPRDGNQQQQDMRASDRSMGLDVAAAAADQRADSGAVERTYSAAPAGMAGTNVAMIVMTAEEFDEFVADHPYLERQVLRAQYRARILVNHNIFNQFFMLLIFVNTVFLTLEYDNMPYSLTHFLDISNYLLTALFAAEITLKLFGLGFWDYIRDGFNIFDALVVTASLLEILLSSMGGASVIRALRVLKALRVIRLFKLFRYMQSLRRIGEVLLSAFSSFAAIATLLVLFWVVFSIVGMHAFGTKDLDTYPWPNFSTFLYSLVATWNVLNLENWQNLMYATIRATDYGVSPYFVMWIIIGRYIFLTLFLAVTLEAFEAKYDPNAVRLGAKTGLSSVLGSVFGSSSSLHSLSRKASSVISSLRNGSGRKTSPPGSPRGGAKRAGGGGRSPGDASCTAGLDRPESACLKRPGGSDMGVEKTAQSVSVRSSFGYTDAQAAAAARYGDGDTSCGGGAAATAEPPRVNIKKMYTIKQWIDTGNMDVLKSEASEVSNVASRWSSVAASFDRKLRGRSSTVDGQGSGAGGGSDDDDTRTTAARKSTSSDVAVPGCGGVGRGNSRTTRGASYINDSAAQSRASSEDTGGGGRKASGSGGGGGGRPVGEGLEKYDIRSTEVVDPTLLPASEQQQGPGTAEASGGVNAPPPSTPAAMLATATRGPQRPGSPAVRLGTAPMLQSLSRAVRRGFEGLSQLGDVDDSELDDVIVSNGVAAGDGGGGGGGGNGGDDDSSAAASWARPTSAMLRSTGVADSKDDGGLILSRANGRMVRLGSRMASGCSSTESKPRLQSTRLRNVATDRGDVPPVEAVTTTVQPSTAPAAAAGVPLPYNYVPPPSAPAPLRGGGLGPELLRMASDGMFDDEDGGSGRGGGGGGSPPLAAAADFGAVSSAARMSARVMTTTATTFSTPACSWDGRSSANSMGQLDDSLGSFMNPVRLATVAAHHAAAAAAVSARLSAEDDAVMATFGDLLVLPPATTAARRSRAQEADDYVRENSREQTGLIMQFLQSQSPAPAQSSKESPDGASIRTHPGGSMPSWYLPPGAVDAFDVSVPAAAAAVADSRRSVSMTLQQSRRCGLSAANGDRMAAAAMDVGAAAAAAAGSDVEATRLAAPTQPPPAVQLQLPEQQPVSTPQSIQPQLQLVLPHSQAPLLPTESHQSTQSAQSQSKHSQQASSQQSQLTSVLSSADSALIALANELSKALMLQNQPHGSPQYAFVASPPPPPPPGNSGDGGGEGRRLYGAASSATEPPLDTHRTMILGAPVGGGSRSGGVTSGDGASGAFMTSSEPPSAWATPRVPAEAAEAAAVDAAATAAELAATESVPLTPAPPTPPHASCTSLRDGGCARPSVPALPLASAGLGPARAAAADATGPAASGTSSGSGAAVAAAAAAGSGNGSTNGSGFPGDSIFQGIQDSAHSFGRAYSFGQSCTSTRRQGRGGGSGGGGAARPRSGDSTVAGITASQQLPYTDASSPSDPHGEHPSLLGDLLGERIRASGAGYHTAGAPACKPRDGGSLSGSEGSLSRLCGGGGGGKGTTAVNRQGELDGKGDLAASVLPVSADMLVLPPATAAAAAGSDAEGGVETKRRGDKSSPPLRRISEAGSAATSELGSRANSFDSRISGGDTEGDEEPNSAEHRRRFQRRRRVSILIEGTGKSFWIWDEDHPAREKAYWLVTHRRFDYAMFGLILLNCVTLALENPHIRTDSPLDKVLSWSNVGFTILFATEALVKMFAYTFVAYIKRITNQVDFLIVVTSFLEIVLGLVTSAVGAVSALRVLRAVKPLRLLTRSAGMRLVFRSVTMSLMSMANVSVVCILFFLIFAILGVQLFGGKFYRCNDDSVAGRAECVGDFTDPVTNLNTSRLWENDWPNFDNTGNALLCCFITATLNGYSEIMVNAMSAPHEVGLQPRQFQNPGAFFWFFGFIVVCAFTLLNLYVGVIFSQFSKIRMLSETGSAFLTSDQNEWAELTKMVFRLKPPDKSQLPTGRLRRHAYHLVHSKSFDAFILTIILINVGFLAATWYGEPEWYTRQKDTANKVFVAFFAVEAAAKIFALGWMAYFKDAWNKLDFLLLALGFLDLFVSMLESNFLRILRIFRIHRFIALVRIARFAQLVKSVKGIQSLFTTLVYSLPAFGNVGALIGLFFFMYAYVGTFLFGKVQYGESLNRRANFHDFFQSLLVLLRIATGDNWTGVMFDCLVQPPHCAHGECGSYLAIPYFLSFVLIISVILLNLFSAVIIETFEKTHEQEEWKLSPQALEDFVTLWSEYDDGSGTILPRHLEELLLRLDPPLGLGPYADNKDVLRFVYDLDIPLVNARVPFHKTAFELVKRCSQATMPEGAIKEQIDRLVDKFFHELAAQDEMLNFSVAITVMKVQRKWRTRMRAAKLLRKKSWRQDRRDAPDYPEIATNKALIVEKFEAYRDAQREATKAWEVRMQALNRKADKSELARRTEPRWRFNPKYAPASLVQATSEKGGGLLGLGRRAMNVNRLVGLLRGGGTAVARGLLGGAGLGASGGSSVADSPLQVPRSPQFTGNGDNPSPSGGGGSSWAAPPGSADAPVAGSLPRLLRAITHTTGQLVFHTAYHGGGAIGPSTLDAAASGRQQLSSGGAAGSIGSGVSGTLSASGMGDAGISGGRRRQPPQRSMTLSPAQTWRLSTDGAAAAGTRGITSTSGPGQVRAGGSVRGGTAFSGLTGLFRIGATAGGGGGSGGLKGRGEKMPGATTLTVPGVLTRMATMGSPAARVSQPGSPYSPLGLGGGGGGGGMQSDLARLACTAAAAAAVQKQQQEHQANGRTINNNRG